MRRENVWSENTERQTCLLNCMIPRVGKTHALAGGTISESAKLTHCSTWAAASGLVPRSSSLPTVEETSSNLQPPILLYIQVQNINILNLNCINKCNPRVENKEIWRNWSMYCIRVTPYLEQLLLFKQIVHQPPITVAVCQRLHSQCVASY